MAAPEYSNPARTVALVDASGNPIAAANLGTAANLASAIQPASQMTTRPGDWSIWGSPAANTQATVTKAAGGAGVRHVVTSVSGTVTSTTTAPAGGRISLALRDGISGSGTLIGIWDLPVAAAANSGASFALSGLNIVGSPNTAMTLEFAAAGGANTFESVTLTGYSIA
jgi:hypothetical protein